MGSSPTVRSKREEGADLQPAPSSTSHRRRVAPAPARSSSLVLDSQWVCGTAITITQHQQQCDSVPSPSRPSRLRLEQDELDGHFELVGVDAAVGLFSSQPARFGEVIVSDFRTADTGAGCRVAGP